MASATPVLGTIWEGVPNAGNASDPANMGASLASANFVSAGINYCSAESPTCPATPYTVGPFLNNPVFTSPVNGFSPTGTADNIEVQLVGSIFLTAGANNFNIAHDDGLTLSLNGGIGTALNDPGPTGPTTTPFVINAPSTGTYTFTLNYAECCGAPAVLEWTDLNGTPIGSAVPEPASMMLLGTGLIGIGARRWRKRRQRS